MEGTLLTRPAQLYKYGLPFLFPALVVLSWQTVHWFNIADPSLLPKPSSTLSLFAKLVFTGDVLPDIGMTLLRTLAGLTLATLTGIILGLLMGSYKPLYAALITSVDFARSIPVITLYPIFVLTLGISHISKIGMVFTACVLIIAINSAYGVIQSSRIRTQMAGLYGASATQIFFWVKLFDALPQTVIGLRIALSISLIVEILCEMFMGSRYGIGQRLIEAFTIYAVEEMYALILIAGLMGVCSKSFICSTRKKGGTLGRTIENITLSGVSKTFLRSSGKQRKVLNDVSIHFEGHRLVTLIGPNGCGKSTLLNLIAGIFEPDSGTIQYNSFDKTKPKIGYVWQDYRASLLPWLNIMGQYLFSTSSEGSNEKRTKFHCSKGLGRVSTRY